jgi:two-component system, chemotaxis family, response regulator PixG
MNTISMASYKPFQKLHPLSLLAQLSSRQTSGCLQVSSGSTTWFIYLEQGNLIYATSSTNPFDRLDRHLRRLSTQASGLVSAVRVQVRLLFEKPSETRSTLSADYQAICWLVSQQHLQSAQLVTLIEELSKEVIESFLLVQEGNYELLQQDQFGDLPKLCQLDLRPLVEQCQIQLRQRQSGRATTSLLNYPGDSDQGRNSPPAEKPQNAAIAPATPTPTSNSFKRKPPAAVSKGTYTIACIDDSLTVLQAIDSFLDDKMFNVLMINNPISALMQIIRNKPDLILLDVTMPSLDGYELCSLLRRHSSFKNTPVIMVTGNTGFIDRAKAKLVGASGYMTKPFTQSDLIKMVFKHLKPESLQR